MKNKPSNLFNHSERRHFFGIRKFKVGVFSVSLGAMILLLGHPSYQVSAQEQAEAVVLATTIETPSPEVTVENAEPVAVETIPALATETSPAVPANATPSEVEETPAVSDQTSQKAEETKVSEQASVNLSPVGDGEQTTPQAVPAKEDVATPSQKDPIAEQTVRLHFETVDQAEGYGLWNWGGVEKPSEPNDWPKAATPFVAGQKDDFGHYLDIKQSATKGDINYLLLKDGNKVTEADQTIKLLSPDTKEIWITKDFKQYAYQPLKENDKIRINYLRPDNNYEGWGVWFWGDTAKTLNGDDWPKVALEFNETGPYGRYVDVPLSKDLASNLGFLLVNKNDPNGAGNKTQDLKFDDREEHSQIFLRQGDDTVYTNPHFVVTNAGQDFTKAVPGHKNIQVTATSHRSFNYNETGIIDVAITNPDKANITKIEVDSSKIGGGKIDVSQELNRVTITASSTTAPGTYELPVRVYDETNGYYDTTVNVTINPRDKKPGERDWDEQVIYFMVTDRFNNGDLSNDNPYKQAYADAKNKAGVYKGGDFKGVTEKLDYLKELGVNSIWLTPIVENVPQNVSTDEGKEYYAYHGYWAKEFEKLNPHLGSLEDFHELIDKAAERNINIIVDIVLNHAGYGAEDKFAGLVRTKEEDQVGDDQKGSLANLPDFKTEEKAVREQLVAWQADWIKRSTTPKGNSIYGFRVDTVKHVDDVAWQHFKNELALRDKDFHLVGESWGANYKDTKGDLGTGTMDSLLDFGFKDIAKLFIGGRVKEAEQELINRNKALSSNYTLAQFLGSHDEDGFLYSIGGDVAKLKVAASLLLTAKGQPVVYYGEEVGQSGKNNWPYYDNRYDFDWQATQTSPILTHYQKLLKFRNENSELLSRGNRTTVSASDSDKWLLSQRSTEKDAAFILYNLNHKKQKLQLEVSDAGASLTDHYSGKVYDVVKEKDGKWYIEVETPSVTDGGTMLFKLSKGTLVAATTLTQEEVEDKIAANHLRVHFKNLPSDNLSSLGLWTWDDVETPSKNWPSGATSFADAKQDDYGYYLDIKLAEGKGDKVGLLINNTSGQNLTENKMVELLSKDMQEVWFDKDYKLHYYKPQAEGTIRINYLRSDKNYANKSLWLWGNIDQSIQDRMGKWPNGIDFEHFGKHGAYLDVKLSDFNELGFLLLDESKPEAEVKIQPNNYLFKDLRNHTQIFLRDDDATIYTNPYFVNHIRMTGAQQISPDKIQATMTSLDGADKATILKNLKLQNAKKQDLEIKDLELDYANKRLTLTGNFAATDAPYQLNYLSDAFTVGQSWQYKDALYDYKGELGARVKEKGAKVDMTIWSPSADKVSVVLYDKDDQNKVVGRIDMAKGDKGEWSTTLGDQKVSDISDYRGYYYHYEIERQGKKVLVLDPYAKSLAEWNSDLAEQGPEFKVAKAAIVDVKETGPKDMAHANIPGFKNREDAIIYEAHVRDFTSDKAISSELTNQFGTFAAFVEKLDYLKNLGVTHIQLLPVMSYYYVNELKNAERMDDYRSSNSNYNWGYDPQSYFALTGMYSTDPTDPAKRIDEFKHLVNEVHKRGMGLILDVVYNHTAKVDIFEDLEPNYYHFMDAQGTPKTSFGGGRLGTTHHMTRRLLVDSIKYLVDEYKVDGFRFDMMGDHDAAAIELAYNEAKKLNPNIIMLGEGWVTFVGDDNLPEQAADQSWMSKTDSVASFSDDMRNTLKSGYPNEGVPSFITGGHRNVWALFNNIKGQPNNFNADDPGDVIQYIAAHDNLTLFDIIAQSIKKDPARAENTEEILKRQRLGNLLVLTSQGTPFIHSGQEYGRTKQFRADSHRNPVPADQVPNKAHLLTDASGKPFDYPYFIHDSYDSSDAINHFDWSKVSDSKTYPNHTLTKDFTKGLIALRRSTDAFRLATKGEVDSKVSLITVPHQDGVGEDDLVIGYQTIASNGDVYAVLVNADSVARDFVLKDKYEALRGAEVLVDAQQAGVDAITNPNGLSKTANGLRLDPLTATVLRLKKEQPTPPVTHKGDANGQALTQPAKPEGFLLVETHKGDKDGKALTQPAKPELDENLVKPTPPNSQPPITHKGDANGQALTQPAKPEGMLPPAHKDDQKERLLYDRQTGISVWLAPDEIADAVGLRVIHLDTKPPKALTGKDADLYDIEVVDSQGRVIDITKPVRVLIPVDTGKKVAEVLYLETDEKVESLPFSQVNHVIDGKSLDFVQFTVNHFSHYALVYQQGQPSGQKVNDKIGSVAPLRSPGNTSNPVAPLVNSGQETASQSQQSVTNPAEQTPLSHQVAKGQASLPATGSDDNVLVSLTGLVGLTSLAWFDRKRRKTSKSTK